MNDKNFWDGMNFFCFMIFITCVLILGFLSDKKIVGFSIFFAILTIISEIIWIYSNDKYNKLRYQIENVKKNIQ